MIIPGEKRRIKEEFDKAREKHGPLTKEQKHKIASKVHKKMKRAIIRGSLITAMGLTTIGVGAKMLNPGEEKEPTQEPTIQETMTEEITAEKSFKEELKVDITEQTIEDEKEENNILEQIVEEYNNQYPEDTIGVDDLGIIESKPQFIVQGRDENGNNYYVQDYKMQAQDLKENEEFLYNGDNSKVDEIYSIINKKEGTIIYSQGAVDAHIVVVDTKVIQDGSGKEYYEGNSITLGDSEAERVIINDKLKDKFKSIVEEKNEEKNSEKQNDDSEMEL